MIPKRGTSIPLAFVALLAVLPTALQAQKLDKKLGRAYWNIFPRGGDSRIPSDVPMTLMMTDSTLELRWKNSRDEAADYVIPIRMITELSGRSNRLNMGLTNWASGEASITIAYDTENDAEAPLFKTDVGDSAQITARIRFRMRKLGMLSAGQ